MSSITHRTAFASYSSLQTLHTGQDRTSPPFTCQPSTTFASALIAWIQWVWFSLPFREWLRTTLASSISTFVESWWTGRAALSKASHWLSTVQRWAAYLRPGYNARETMRLSARIITSITPSNSTLYPGTIAVYASLAHRLTHPTSLNIIFHKMAS